MKKFKFLKKEETSDVPNKTGVYAFLENKEFLYIGKASNLRERVKNHFRQPSYRDGLFLEKISKIGYIETGSEIEALILEADLIKIYQPKYNVLWKDDKNYFYVGITKEDFPRIFITHQPSSEVPSEARDGAKIEMRTKFSSPTEPQTKVKMRTEFSSPASPEQSEGRVKMRTEFSSPLKSAFVGPFVEGGALKKTLRTLRRVFPYHSIKNHPKGPCPWCHLGLCPGPAADKTEYQKNIGNLIGVLRGKKKLVLGELKRDMKESSLSQNYEKAAKIRDRILALERTISQAKIFTERNDSHSPADIWEKTEKKLKKLLGRKGKISKLEAYDVSNIQGNFATGSMVTFIEGRPAKKFYRKFKVKLTNKPNDVAMLKEVLARRLKHVEWPYPDLMLIDGGKAQLNVAINLKSNPPFGVQNLKLISIAALAKRKSELYVENRKKAVLMKNSPREIFNLILHMRDEAHRFAISYHKKLRLKTLLK